MTFLGMRETQDDPALPWVGGEVFCEGNSVPFDGMLTRMH